MEFIFSQNQTIDDINKVPEHFRGAYKQEGDKYVLNAEFKGFYEAIDGLGSALGKERKAKKEPDLTPVLTQFGVDSLEALQEKITGLETTVADVKSGKVNWEKMKADLEKAHQKALETEAGKTKKMEGSLHRYLVESAAVNAISEAKGVSDLLLPHIRDRVKVVMDGDDYVVRVVDKAGDPRGDGKGGFMGVKELVAEMKADKTFGRAFESDAPAGGGSQQRQAPSKISNQGGEKTSTSKIADGLAKRGIGVR
jgi:hypothetical protein